MKIYVHSRNTIQYINPVDPYIVISVTDEEQPWANVVENQNCLGVLKMHFHDADRGVRYSPKHLRDFDKNQELRIFSRENAQEMLDFVAKHSDAKMLICQCDAGISRSAGIAAAFGKILHHDDAFIFDNPRYNPNRTVYRTILVTYYTQE